MANENGSLVANGPAPPAKPAPGRVAQLSARLKAVTQINIGERKKSNVQKRPAPVLPSEARPPVDKPQELNAYVTAMARGEVSAQLSILLFSSCRLL